MDRLEEQCLRLADYPWMGVARLETTSRDWMGVARPETTSRDD